MPEEIFDFTQQITQDDPLRKKISERYKYAAKFFSDWNEEAKDDYKFSLGDQWSEEDREALRQQGRPCLTFNRIRPLINLVSGYQRENAARIKVSPEGGEDRIFSEVMDRTIKAVDKWSHLNYKSGYWFDDGCYCGKGWLEAVLTYDKDPIRGELDFKQRSPYQILPDPDFLEYDLNDGCRYVFKVVKLTKSELLELYPKKSKIIKNLVKDSAEDDPSETILAGVLISTQGEDYDNDTERMVTTTGGSPEEELSFDGDIKYLVKECWESKKVTKYFVIDKETGEPQRFNTKEQAEAFIAQQGFGKYVERKQSEMRVSAMCAGWVLQKEELSPLEPYYTGYPFFRFLADWAPNAENEVLRTQGLTRQLKDPQREKNKAKSQNLHILSTQANSGWIGDDDALTKRGWEDLEEHGSKTGLVVKKKKGSELREILPKGPNAGMIQREEKADEEFYRISTINPDLLGFKEGNLSGKAMGLRIRQGILALARLFFNYRYSKEIVGRFILEMVPGLFDTKKLMKVLGVQYMRTALDPQKYPEGLGEGHVSAFLQMVKDHKYDVYVTEAGENATIRFEIFQSLVEVMKVAPGSVPVDLLIDYLDVPNSEELKSKIKEQQNMLMAAAQSAKGAPGAGPGK